MKLIKLEGLINDEHIYYRYFKNYYSENFGVYMLIFNDGEKIIRYCENHIKSLEIRFNKKIYNI